MTRASRGHGHRFQTNEAAWRRDLEESDPYNRQLVFIWIDAAGAEGLPVTRLTELRNAQAATWSKPVEAFAIDLMREGSVVLREGRYYACSPAVA